MARHEESAAGAAREGREIPDGPELGLALSGGGVRAALFSLGVILGLIETGWHRRVRCIASVSGGSIVNAALAHVPGLRCYSTVDDFAPVASRLAASLASIGAGAFNLRSIGAALWLVARIFGRMFIPLVAGVLFLLKKLQESEGFDLGDVGWGTLPWGWILGIGAGSLLVVLLLSRGLLQEAKFRSILRSVAGTRGRLYLRDWGGKESGEGGGSVMQVLVATDLLSGEPIYFSKCFVYCRPYGWSPPGELETPEALYSSAAFPGVFPHKRLRRKRLEFRNGEMAGELPKTLHLADGGIYNNLGYDWFEVLRREQGLGPGGDGRPANRPIWQYGEVELDNEPRVDRYIVVNAGALSRAIDKIGILMPIARIMSVLYDNTVRPRVRSIRKEKKPLIDIDESPAELARRLAAELDGEQGRRAGDLAERLATKSDRFWDDFTRQTSGTATKLSPAGHRTGARLLLHGYLSTLVLLHAWLGAELPNPLRGEDYFFRLVKGDVRPVAPPPKAEKEAEDGVSKAEGGEQAVADGGPGQPAKEGVAEAGRQEVGEGS